MDWMWNVAGIVALVLAGAFFAMSEIALAGARRTRLQQQAEKGDDRADLVLRIKDNPASFFSVVQIGINAVAILGGIVGEQALTDLFMKLFVLILPPEMVTTASFACSFVVITLIFVLFADLIPKRVAMNSPEAVAVAEIRWMKFLIVVLKPFVWFLNALSEVFIKLFRLPAKPTNKITSEDIMATVAAGAEAGLIAPNEQAAITNVMDLESRLVPSAMTTRDSVVWVDIDDSYETIVNRITEFPHDKYLVCDGDIDHVVGHVDSKELLKLVVKKNNISLKNSDCISNTPSVPDALTLAEMLAVFKSQHTDFAVVVNEYALTVGIVTLNDVLLSVMGEFVSAEEAQIVCRDDGSWLVDGATPVDDIERTFGFDRMPQEETYETIAGFMMYMLRKIPKRTDKVDYMGYRFEVIGIENRHIDQILVTRIAPGAKPAGVPTPKPSSDSITHVEGTSK
ncbi:MAG: hemolysin family protein [Sutterellaceae bacterium]|nr:hemolysin family protein [Sutterellaceae bacterium]